MTKGVDDELSVGYRGEVALSRPAADVVLAPVSVTGVVSDMTPDKVDPVGPVRTVEFVTWNGGELVEELYVAVVFEVHDPGGREVSSGDELCVENTGAVVFENGPSELLRDGEAVAVGMLVKDGAVVPIPASAEVDSMLDMRPDWLLDSRERDDELARLVLAMLPKIVVVIKPVFGLDVLDEVPLTR